MCKASKPGKADGPAYQWVLLLCRSSSVFIIPERRFDHFIDSADPPNNTGKLVMDRVEMTEPARCAHMVPVPNCSRPSPLRICDTRSDHCAPPHHRRLMPRIRVIDTQLHRTVFHQSTFNHGARWFCHCRTAVSRYGRKRSSVYTLCFCELRAHDPNYVSVDGEAYAIIAYRAYISSSSQCI